MGKVNGQGPQVDRLSTYGPYEKSGSDNPPSSQNLLKRVWDFTFARLVSKVPPQTSGSSETKPDIGLLYKRKSASGYAGEYLFGEGKPLKSRKSMSPRMRELQNMADERNARLEKEKYSDACYTSQDAMKWGDGTVGERTLGDRESWSERTQFLDSIVRMATDFRQLQDSREGRQAIALIQYIKGELTAEQLCDVDPSRESQVLLNGSRRIEAMHAERKILESRIVEARNTYDPSAATVLENQLEALNLEIAQGTFEQSIRAESHAMSSLQGSIDKWESQAAHVELSEADKAQFEEPITSLKLAIKQLSNHVKFMKAALAASGAAGMAGMLGVMDQRIAQLEGEIAQLDISADSSSDADIQADEHNTEERVKNSHLKHSLAAELTALKNEREELSPTWADYRKELSLGKSGMHDELQKAVAARNKRVTEGSYQMRDHKSTLDAGNNDYTDSLAGKVRSQGLGALDKHDKRIVDSEHLRLMEYRVNEMSESMAELSKNMREALSSAKRSLRAKQVRNAFRLLIKGVIMFVRKTRLEKRVVKQTVAILSLRKELNINDGLVKINQGGELPEVNKQRLETDPDARYAKNAGGYYLDGDKFEWRNFNAEHAQRELQQKRNEERLARKEHRSEVKRKRQQVNVEQAVQEMHAIEEEQSLAKEAARQAKLEDQQGQVELEQLRNRMENDPEQFAQDLYDGNGALDQRPAPERFYADDLDLSKLPKIKTKKKGKKRKG